MNIETLLDRARQGDTAVKGELRARAQNGEADALWALGEMYATGWGLPQKLDKAVECYRRAAEQGHVEARKALAVMACGKKVGKPRQGATLLERDKIFALLESVITPTLPALWTSTDAGETWVWGDFFMMLQKEPVTTEESLCEEAGKPAPDKRLFYPYVMTAFYRLDRNPHGPSFRPVVVASLEQSDQNSFREFMGKLGAKMRPPDGRKWGVPFLCMFTPDRHVNFGVYPGDLEDRETVRAHFFAMLGEYLGLDGQPRMIGTMADAPGHPETGLPV